MSSLSEGAFDQTASVTTSAGTWVTHGGTYANVHALAQPGTVSVSSDGTYTHYAGFIGSSFLRPHVLSANGIPIEADPDNDGDGLEDSTEIDGSAFVGLANSDPNNPDTDGDGMTDSVESNGGFDPTDAAHHLSIVSLELLPGGNFRVHWIGRGGGTRHIVWTENQWGGFGNALSLTDTNIMGGTAPWYKVTNSFTWTGTIATNRFIFIESIR
ncbi:MAG: hypothetical protein GKR87_06240 [Kiritimatiellae bacterium]|nr:hypothetical protein [Kiritimatiellia bacterium]